MANCISNSSASSPVVPLVDQNRAESFALNSEIPSSYVETSTESCENGISTTIDSALLCAMRDARERHGLLRLEQVMIDFMNQETSGYIEVGGANNSLVYSPSGSILSGNKSLSNNTADGSRQTSFQRCCLHRLADRFGILREQNEQGMIRLVKVKESCIPNQLLIDLQPSDYEEQQQPDLVRGLAATKLSDTSIGTKPMPKMKIMKRSSSGLGSSNSLKSEKGASKNKSKKLSDKEKAYAEARARIFAESTAAAGGGVGERVVASNAVGSVNGDTKLATPERTASSKSLPSSAPDTTATTTTLPVDTDDDRMARNKATYRNRQEEENDPDFQRLSSSASSSLHGYGVADAYGGQAQYGYNPQQQHFYPASGYAYPQQQGYAVGGEIFYPAPPLSTQQQQGARPAVMRRQDSAASDANSNKAMMNLDEFPSLGA